MRKLYICCFLQHQIFKGQKSINHDEYCYHRKQFILTSANSYCNFIFFSYTVYYSFHCQLPHCTYDVSLSFFWIALGSRCSPFKRFILVL